MMSLNDLVAQIDLVAEDALDSIIVIFRIGSNCNDKHCNE
jgi:hypothetical protein